MRGIPTQKTHHPHTGIRWPFSVGRFPHTTRGAFHRRNLAGLANTDRRDCCRYRWLARLAKQGRLVNGLLAGGQGR